jgi:C4-dicarboxylate transporter DctM subunit
VFTPTEAGAACVFYLLLWGTVITRKLTFSAIVSSLRQTAITSSVVLILMANAKIVAWLLTTALIPQKCGAFLMSFSTSPYFFLTLVVLFLVFLGFFIEAIAIMIMFVPVLAPIASSYGISPTHFGLIFVMAIQIALITPPVALALFVTTKIAGVALEDVFMEMIPFLCVITIITLIIVYVPDVSLWLPRLFGYT